mgnify:FL=1
MNKIGDTELIINDENRIYHLNLKKDEIADNIILVGDPSRVSQISKKFEKIEYKIEHREFITHTGFFKNKRISVISSGIGTDNIDIVVNELDALVNIDFKTKQINKTKKSLNIIRLGTSGSLNKSINIDSFLVSEYAIGFDGLAHYYNNDEILDKKLQDKFIEYTNWDRRHSKPYALKCSDILLNKFNDLEKGITLTATGFYGPQSRELRLKSTIKDLNKIIDGFKYKNQEITNFEMETSALYFLASCLGHNCLTVCAILGNRLKKEQSKKAIKTIDKLIDIVLEKL